MKKRLATPLLLTYILLTAVVPAGLAQEARHYLQKSVAAYGSWGEVKTLEYQVSGSRDAGTQGKTYKSGERHAYTARRMYNLPEKKLYEENQYFFPGGYAFKFATIVQDTTAYNYDVDGTRSGKVYNTAGKATAEGRSKVVNNHIAYFKVLELLQSADSLVLQQPDTGHHTIIKRLNAQHTATAEYYFSNKTKLLEKVVALQSGQPLELLFGNYSKIAGRLENSSVLLLASGKVTTEETIRVSRVNFPFDQRLLQLPEGYVLNKPVASVKPKEIAKDIYLIEHLAGDRNVLFVNMDEYIVVIEAPISADLSKQVIGMIREVEPHKPIRYVFTTHYHSDHTGGLRQYAHEGAALLMTAHSQKYVTDLLAAPQQDDFGKSGKAAATYQTIAGTYTLQDDNHLIEFHEVPNSHADGMALAYFPREQLIYQGDLLSMPLDGTLPYGIEVTQDMDKFLKKKSIVYTRMIGHHGHSNITPELLEQIVKHRPTHAKRAK